MRPLANQKRLAELFDYLPESGTLVWKARPRSDFGNPATYGAFVAKHQGKPAGSVDKHGYIVVSVDDVVHPAHRVVWVLHYGTLPELPLEIDHINGDRADNRLANLRTVTRRQNIRNANNYRHNKSGVRGVFLRQDTQKWVAKIRSDQGEVTLGNFVSKHEATIARRAAEKVLGYTGSDRPAVIDHKARAERKMRSAS